MSERIGTRLKGPGKFFEYALLLPSQSDPDGVLCGERDGKKSVFPRAGVVRRRAPSEVVLRGLPAAAGQHELAVVMLTVARGALPGMLPKSSHKARRMSNGHRTTVPGNKIKERVYSNESLVVTNYDFPEFKRVKYRHEHHSQDIIIKVCQM